MGVVTAAVIAGAATVAATGASIASQQGAFGGSSSGGSSGDFRRTPLDPHQRAMRDYYARMAVVNQDANYPSFGEFLTSGGDPSKANFDLTTPGMKPSEAAALGLTGGRGEAIPYYDQAAAPGTLSPEQRIYLARERQRHAAETGRKMPTYTWAESTLNAADRYARLKSRLGEATAVPVDQRTPKQEKQIRNIPGRLEDISGRNPNLKLGAG